MKKIILLFCALSLFLFFSACPVNKPQANFADGKARVDAIWSEAGISRAELFEMKEVDFGIGPSAAAGWNEKLGNAESKLSEFKQSLSSYGSDAELAKLREYVEMNILLAKFIREKNSLAGESPLAALESVKAALESIPSDLSSVQAGLSRFSEIREKAKNAKLAALQLNQAVHSFRAQYAGETESDFGVELEKIGEIISLADRVSLLVDAVELEERTEKWFSSFSAILSGGTDCSSLPEISDLVAEAESLADLSASIAERFGDSAVKEKSDSLYSSLTQLKSIEAQLRYSCE